MRVAFMTSKYWSYSYGTQMTKTIWARKMAGISRIHYNNKNDVKKSVVI